MGCPHLSHLVKTPSIEPMPLSVSGVVREYSLRLLSQFLILSPNLRTLHRRSTRERLTYPTKPLPGHLRPTLPDELHQLAPDDDPIGLRRRGLSSGLRRRYAEAQRHRRLRPGAHPAQELHGPRRQGVARPRHPRDRDAVHEPRRQLSDPREPLVGRGRRRERAEGDANVRGDPGEPPNLVHGEVRYDEPRNPCLRRLAHKLFDPSGEHDVVVDEEHHRYPAGEPGGEPETIVHVCPVFERRGGSVLDRRTVRQRVGERDPDLDDVRPGRNVSLSLLLRPVESRVAGRQVRHQRDPVVPKRRPEPLVTPHEETSSDSEEVVASEVLESSATTSSSALMSRASATTSTSLSPRPERFMTRFFAGPSSLATFSA